MEPNTHSQQTDAQAADEILALLSDQRRRHAVAVVDERDGPTTIRDLAAAVALREADQNDASADEIDEIAIDLHHVHLPKLDDAGVVDYDARTNTVVAAHSEALSSFYERREAVTARLF